MFSVKYTDKDMSININIIQPSFSREERFNTCFQIYKHFAPLISFFNGVVTNLRTETAEIIFVL